MNNLFTEFHFIRQEWLYTLFIVAFIITGFVITRHRKNQWSNVIDAHLLQHLLVGEKKLKQRIFSSTLFISLAFVLMVLALAGPTWEKRPLPVFESEVSKVILLDLSLSMNSTDIKPNRLTRAKHKVNDLLSKTKEGQVALIVYAGDAFVISPLTTDSKTIQTLVPPLDPAIMPVLGSEPKQAFELADQLLENAGVFSGQIIWITDGIDDQDYALVSQYLKTSRHQLSILAVGTADGAPIPLPDGQGFLKNSSGTIVLPTLQIASLKQLAKAHQGTLTLLTADDSDIQRLIKTLKKPEEFIASDDDLKMDSWIEIGPWLLFPVIIILAFAFRKGIVVVLVLMAVPFSENPSLAAEENSVPVDTQDWQQTASRLWDGLWLTPDQQAIRAYKKDQSGKAAELFERPDWKAASLYKSGQFHAASDTLATQDTATAYYNRGNSLAKSDRLEESIAAYEQALEQNPTMEDAKFNKSLVEQLLKQQQEQKDQQKNDQDQQNKDQQQKDGEQQEGEQDPSEDEQQKDAEPQEQDNEQNQQQDQDNEEKTQQQTELEKMTEAEKEQELEQWLRMIKDDPGGLLRRKMYMEYQKRQQQGKNLQNKGEKVW